jgi:hypothetical protein
MGPHMIVSTVSKASMPLFAAIMMHWQASPGVAAGVAAANVGFHSRSRSTRALAAVGQLCEGPSKAQADGSLRSAVLELKVKRGRAMVESALRPRARAFDRFETAIHG